MEIETPNDQGNPAAAKNIRFQKPPDPPLRCIGLFVVFCSVDDLIVALRLEVGQPVRQAFRLRQPEVVPELRAVR